MANINKLNKKMFLEGKIIEQILKDTLIFFKLSPKLKKWGVVRISLIKSFLFLTFLNNKLRKYKDVIVVVLGKIVEINKMKLFLLKKLALLFQLLKMAICLLFKLFLKLYLLIELHNNIDFFFFV